jgi:hypothetical protein
MLTSRMYRATYSLGDFEAVLEAISSGMLHSPQPLLSRDESTFSVLTPLARSTLACSSKLLLMRKSLATGRMKPEGMITKKIKLDEVVEEGFHTLIDDKENHVKILVDVAGSTKKS